MLSVKLMDVTLRDGGYRTNFNFSNQAVEKIITGLDNSKIDYIEVGYKRGSARPINNIGQTGMCEKPYLDFCRKLIHSAKMTVILHPKNLLPGDLEELVDCGVDTVRVCVGKNQLEAAKNTVIQAKKLGLEVAANITRMSHYTDAELNRLVAELCGIPVDILYLADSNGSMHPSRVQYLFENYTKQYEIPFGYHAHDNLGLAQANALSAIAGGARWIDVSLSGIGKGIGNLRTEFFVAYLESIYIKKYSVSEILKLANYVKKCIIANDCDISLNEFEMGIMDLSADDIKKMQMAGEKPCKLSMIK